MAQEVWTVRKILDWTCGYLERKGDEHPRLSAEWLLGNACGLSRIEIYMNFDRPLAENELALMRDAVRRRGAGEPLQYVTGDMPFRHIIVRCERGVLIPRPETEVLVDAALEGVDAARERGRVFSDGEEHARARLAQEAAEAARTAEEEPKESGAAEATDVAGGTSETGEAEASEGTSDEPLRESVPAGPRVLEVGTGTGCIALSIASERPGTTVWATDLSEVAVPLARRNRDALGLTDVVRIRECDLAAGVPQALMGTFSVLVSNPPYIPSAVVPTLPYEVQGFEPHLALDGGVDGLDLFRRILGLAPLALMPGGMLCVELFEENVHAAADLTRAQGGWQTVEVREDLTHRPRVLVAVRES